MFGRLALGAVTAVLLLAGCTKAQPEDPASGTETGMETTTAETAIRSLLAGHLSEYRVVRAEDAGKREDTVMRALCDSFGQLGGDKPEQITDFEAFFEKQDGEIVFGKTTRTAGTVYEETLDSLAAGEYALAVDETERRIYLLFCDDAGMLNACEALLAEVYPNAEVRTVWGDVLLKRGVQRYPFTLHFAMQNGMTLPAGETRIFAGTTESGRTVSFCLTKDGQIFGEESVQADGAGEWQFPVLLPEAGEEYSCSFYTEGYLCAQYTDISLDTIFVERARGFSVAIDGVPQTLYQTQNGCHLIAETEKDTVTVTVTYDRTFTAAEVLPSSAGIVPEIEGQTMTFTVPVPSKLSVEISGNLSRSVQLFLYGAEKNQPEPGADVLWFAPGEYTYEEPIALRDNQTVYLETGAVVHAKFIAENCQNVTICGRGIIDTYGLEEANMLVFSGCRNVVLRDYSLFGARKWMTVFKACDGVQADHINIIGTKINSDGIDIVGSRNVAVNGAYICANDDCIALKSMEGSQQKDVENVTFTDCILWNQEYGNAIQIGFETRCESIRNICFENIDIIHVVAGAALSITLGDRAHVSEVVYRNIRIHDARGALVSFGICTTQYSRDSERGTISGVLFDGLEVEDDALGAIAIQGFDSGHRITDVSFTGVRINGKTVAAADLRNLTVSFAEKISWEGVELAG